jgi:hypothetical protein
MKGLIRTLARGKPQTQAIRRQRIRLNNFPITTTGLTGSGFGTAVIGDLPEGNILVLGGAANLQVTGLSAGTIAAFTGSYAIGSTPTADATLTGTDINLIGVATLAAATGKVSPVTRGVNATAAMLDNTDNSLELNLNLVLDDASVSADGQSFTVSGVVDIVYSVLLDD